MDKNTYTDFDGRTYHDNGEGRYSGDVPLLNDSPLGLGGGDLRSFRNSSTRVHLSVFLYLMISYAVVYAVSLVLVAVYNATSNVWIDKLIDSPIFNIALSSVAQYAIAFPLFAVIIKALTKPVQMSKSKMHIGELLILFVICESLMLFGSIIGNYAGELFGNLFGLEASNAVDEIISETPTWLIFVGVVVLAPIFEELIYRKLFIDRMMDLGDGCAIIFSALAFGLMHMNIYQLFYAFGVGLVLGYIYTRTRDVRYTIVMHMLLNFMGSIITMPVINAQEKLIAMEEALANGLAVDEAAYMTNALLVFLYSGFQFIMAIGGIVALILYIYKGKLKLSVSGIPNKKSIAKAGVLNAGFIAFAAFSIIMTVLSLILGG